MTNKDPRKATYVSYYIYGILICFNLLLIASCSDKRSTTGQNTSGQSTLVKSTLAQRDYLSPETLCGEVQFTDGCSSKLDTLIRFGIALIHHMTYEEAEYTFKKVIKLDADCFWGYWGRAMTFIHPLWSDVPDEKTMEEGYILSQTALKLAKTKKEKLYGAAIASYFQNDPSKTKPERLFAFNDAWQAASKDLPEDIEARLFAVLSTLATAPNDDKTFKKQREAGAIAEMILKKYPDHPGAYHYAIHAYDFPPLAENALRIARSYYKIAPELPHALHMPTHIFTRLGYWQESIDLNLRAAAAAIKMPVEGKISGQYFHALDYLAYAYLQQSEYKKAKALAILLDTLSGSYAASPNTAYALAAIPARTALEYQDWSGTAKLSLNNHSHFPWSKFPQMEALIYFAKGIGAARIGNVQQAGQSHQKLEELQNTFKKSEANKYWIDQIEIQKEAVKAWILFAQGENEKALKTIASAANLEDATEKLPVTPGQILPAREMLGDLLLELKKPKEALVQYEHSLENCPGRFNSLYGAGKSAELLGDRKKAAAYFSLLLKNNKSSISDRERLRYAQSIINKVAQK